MRYGEEKAAGVLLEKDVIQGEELRAIMDEKPAWQ